MSNKRARQVVQLEVDYDPEETVEPRKWDWDGLVEVFPSELIVAGWSRVVDLPDVEEIE
jgi:hypothetical protein